MWPWGHLAGAYVLYTVSTRKRFDEPPAHGPVLVLVFASLLPDLVDKPLAWYLGVLPTGRTLAHSLVVLVPLSIAVYHLACRYDRREHGVAFAVGVFSHAALDALPALWNPEANAAFLLWPLVPVEGYERGSPSVVELFLASLGEPYFLSEFVLLALAVVLWRRDGYPGLEPLRERLGR